MKILSKKYIAVLGLAAGLLGASSCKKILELEPHNTTFTGAYFTNGQDANTAISGAYSLLRSALFDNYSYHVFGDAPSNEFSINGSLDNANYNISRGEFTGLNVGPGIWNWKNYFKLLQQINLVINKVPGIPIEKFTNQDDKARIIGEAHFLRAYTYFYMSRVWGDIPLKLAPDLDVSQAVNVPRSPAAAVLKQCLADVKIAEDNLTFGYNDENERAVRANKGSAFALEAHIKAWQHDYAGSEVAANTVITQGGYALADSSEYAKVFIGKSLEGIFEINVSYGQGEGISLNGGGYAPTLAAPFIDKRTQVNWPTNKEYINKIFKDSTDFRYRKFLFQAQSTVGQTIKFSNITYADGSAKNDPRLSNNLIIFRLADIMLLRAEALNQLGRDNEAVILLNRVRQRAHVPSINGVTGDALTSVILQERLRELYYEGQSYYDLVRTLHQGSTTAHYFGDYNSVFSDDRINTGGALWPIDPNMFKDDFVITQTPYWQGKL
ncbi:RagB/SusD family nutrient uptake outer membrane protein [Mucilaginibacter gynuensis]|uniref:RagB/SusD family nutrient uptake outer membrane protein n=1 Tax=Mucilaginibacter gynuensis TaxID=1302236 RepID=A0ABP8G9Z3_9SPHI